MTTTSMRDQLCHFHLTALCFCLLLAITASPSNAYAGASLEQSEAFSRANTLLFLTDHLDNVRPPSTLHYAFEKQGSMEEPFRDSIRMKLTEIDEGKRKVDFKYFTGARNQYLHPIINAEGNPVITIFLQRDVVNMESRTDGTSLYFQNAIKTALEEEARVKPVKLDYNGRTVDGVEIRVTPYRNDPHADELDVYANKYYVFTLSDFVPGNVYELRTVIPDATPGQVSNDDQHALLTERLKLQRVQPSH